MRILSKVTTRSAQVDCRAGRLHCNECVNFCGRIPSEERLCQDILAEEKRDESNPFAKEARSIAVKLRRLPGVSQTLGGEANLLAEELERLPRPEEPGISTQRSRLIPGWRLALRQFEFARKRRWWSP